jgi:hypothetical protein
MKIAVDILTYISPLIKRKLLTVPRNPGFRVSRIPGQCTVTPAVTVTAGVPVPVVGIAGLPSRGRGRRGCRPGPGARTGTMRTGTARVPVTRRTGSLTRSHGHSAADTRRAARVPVAPRPHSAGVAESESESGGRPAGAALAGAGCGWQSP